MDDETLSELIARRAGLIESRSATNRALTGLNQEITAELTRRGLDRYEGAILTRRRRFRPFVAQDLIDQAGLSSRERAALTKEVLDVEALKELRPDIYDAACEPGDPYLVQRGGSEEERGAGVLGF